MQKKNLGDLTDQIFEAMQMLQNGKIDVETAKGIAQLAQVAVNATKTQLDGVRIFGDLGGDFIPLAFQESRTLVGHAVVELPADNTLLSPLQKELLASVKKNKGNARIDKCTTDRRDSVAQLRVLEKKGLIICVAEPDFIEDDCGIWILADNPKLKQRYSVD